MIIIKKPALLRRKNLLSEVIRLSPTLLSVEFSSQSGHGLRVEYVTVEFIDGRFDGGEYFEEGREGRVSFFFGVGWSC